jgi:hypothetical protein
MAKRKNMLSISVYLSKDNIEFCRERRVIMSQIVDTMLTRYRASVIAREGPKISKEDKAMSQIANDMAEDTFKKEKEAEV